CPGCGARQTGLLPDTAAASAFGPRLQAAVVTLSVRNRISRRDVVELCQQLFSSRISTGTVDAILARAADALTEPCEDLLGAFCLFGARKGRPERAGPGRARGRALRPQHPAPEGFACPDMPAQEDAFARDYEPGEIAEIAKKLREDAGFSRTAEPTRSAGRAGACDRARYVQCCICG
ncbi:MAG TPA: hypothetical protein VK501_14070, partial [Baekduia sp.]|nr:hypothetical protein [Baekduia sp.]